MNGPKGYYAKWSKSHRENQIPYDFTFMESKKTQSNKMKQNQTLRYKEQAVFARGERGGRTDEIGERD